MNTPAPTPAVLAERLRAAPGSKDRFGATASEVLETAALVAAAHLDWDKATIAAFQDQQGIHTKVWGKLVSIAKSKKLKGLPEKDLPASYTALYALEVMSPQELQAAVAEDLLKVTPLSSRVILDWTKAFRFRGTGIEQEIPLTLVLREELSEQQHQVLPQRHHTTFPCLGASPHSFFARPAELVSPPAHRLPAGETPRRWRAAVRCTCGNGGVFPEGARLPRLPPPHSQHLHKTPAAVKGLSQHQRHPPRDQQVPL